jgi:release factor glutamine methyltransferase
VVALDASEAALIVARENAQRLKIKNVQLLHSDWFAQLADEKFDLIVSNPPYIEADDVHLSQGDVRFEPLSALASGDDGLDDIRRIVVEAKSHLNAGGWLMFEHGYNQAARVRELLQVAGFFGVSSVLDLSGIERVTQGRLDPEAVVQG